MTTEKAHQVAQMAMEHAAAWSAGALEKIAELFAENGSITVNGGDPHVGRAAISENAKELLATFPGLVVHCHQTRQAGDRAVFIWTLEGQHADTGELVSLPGWHEWELDDDTRVKRCCGFFDASDLARQITGK